MAPNLTKASLKLKVRPQKDERRSMELLLFAFKTFIVALALSLAFMGQL
jgi:hypothetical protein